jgi:hypothetical protein
MIVSHFGSVGFQGGQYKKETGSTDWEVHPIPGFDPPIELPLGQVKIEFSNTVDGPYAVIVSAHRSPGAPLLAANYGDADATGFVVHLFDPVNSRTVQNGGFSFAVMHTEKMAIIAEAKKIGKRQKDKR